MKTGCVFAGVLFSVCLVQGQVVLTSQDMFNAIGQYYRVYANKNNVDVSSLVGTNGGPQTWTFTSGPQDLIYRFDYVSPSDGGNGANFPLAKIAERQTNESTGIPMAWNYFDQVLGTGRKNFGFVNPGGLPAQGQFNPPIVDFPDPLKYQSSWNVNTTYDFNYQDILPMRINYIASAKVDAYGTIILPGLGALPCLRINEVDENDILLDADLSGDYQSQETDYIHSYYFLSPGHGIVAEIHSQQSTTAAPPDNFTTAAQFTRMFDFSRAGTSSGPAPVTDLKLEFQAGIAVLNWSRTANTTSYRLEYSYGLGGTNTWQSLNTTTNDYMLDISSASNRQRFYRVVSLGQ